MEDGDDRPELTPVEFDVLRALVHDEAGIVLNESRRTAMRDRLWPRLRARELRSFGRYLRLAAAERVELDLLLERVCVHETHFFREPDHFRFLAQVALPALHDRAERGLRPRRLKVWSAACATGEEPFSLAMLLRDHLDLPGWELEVLGSDISERALARARSATWPMTRAEEIPESYLRRFMLRGTGSQEGVLRAGAALRKLVRFERINLNRRPLPVASSFDLIFCRNVLIYFSPEARQRTVEDLLGRLAPDGFMMLGHAESLVGVNHRGRMLRPSIYTLPDSPLAGEAP